MRAFGKSAVADSVIAKSRLAETRVCAACGAEFTARVVCRRQVRCPECQAKLTQERQRRYSREARLWKKTRRIAQERAGTRRGGADMKTYAGDAQREKKAVSRVFPPCLRRRGEYG